jgi:hypothetical protein
MNSMGWIVLLPPPLFSWLIWRKVSDAHAAGVTRRRAEMPKYGFWGILGISYVVMIAAVLERRL